MSASPDQYTFDEIVTGLRRVELFAEVKQEILSVVARQVEIVILQPGETLFYKGDPADAIYVVMEGALQVHDARTVFNTLGATHTFGEYAFLADRRRTASVTATARSTLLRLAAHEFETLLAKNLQIATGVIRGLIRRITTEKDKSEELLQNILPREVADEYKVNARVEPRKYDRVSVMFVDFAGFTRVSRRLAPESVIEELNHCFSGFDEITDKYRIQKIKTMGDGYMCVGGVPTANRTNPLDCVLAALEMQQFMRERSAYKMSRGQRYWQCRLGINTGDAVAAVIGKSRFSYDVWSDTVNVASRLESTGVVGKVNIGEATYGYVKDFFDCEHRGRIETRGRGKLDMYLVHGIRPELSRDGEGIETNDAFQSLKEAMFDDVGKEVPANA